MEKIYGMNKLVGLQLFRSGTPTFSNGTPTFGQMGVLNSCFQNPSESSESTLVKISNCWKSHALANIQLCVTYITRSVTWEL